MLHFLKVLLLYATNTSDVSILPKQFYELHLYFVKMLLYLERVRMLNSMFIKNAGTCIY